MSLSFLYSMYVSRRYINKCIKDYKKNLEINKGNFLKKGIFFFNWSTVFPCICISIIFLPLAKLQNNKVIKLHEFFLIKNYFKAKYRPLGYGYHQVIPSRNVRVR